MVFLFDGGSHYGCWAKGAVVEPVSNDNKKDVFVTAYIIIVLYVIVLWRKFNCVKIPQSEANKIRESLG